MFGKKLSGRWHLVRTRMQGKQPQWLLIKSRDSAARVGADADVIDAGDADDPKRVPKGLAATKPAPKPKRRAAPKARSTQSRGARGNALPANIKPMLATLVDKVPGNEGWVYELKYDGVRLLCRCDGEDVRCISRNGIDWTHKVGPVVNAFARLDLDSSWIDGELIVTDPNGRSDFSLLQHTMETRPHRGAAVLHLRSLVLSRRRSSRPSIVAAQGAPRRRFRQTTGKRAITPCGSAAK
jgi:bifunctional non-homologous end joining protein LigD